MLLKRLVLLLLIPTALSVAIPHDDDDDDMDMGMDMDSHGMNPHKMGSGSGSGSDDMMSTDIATTGEDNSFSGPPVPHEVKHVHSMPILQTDLTPRERAYWEAYNTTTYFSIESSHKGLLWYHILSLSSSFLFLYPIAMIFNSVKSKWYIPVMTLHTGNLVSSLLSLKVYGSSVPDLYPHNAYAKMSWILFFACIVQYCVAILYSSTNWVYGEWLSDERPAQSFIPLQEMDLEQGSGSASPTPSTLIDNEAGNSSEMSGLQRTQSPETYKDSLDLEGLDGEYSHNRFPSSQGHPELKTQSGRGFTTRDSLLNKVFYNPTVKYIAEKFNPIITIIFYCMNLPMLFYLFIYVSTGVCVGGMIGQGKHVFNVLAHVIKGGVFMSLGVLSLVRYCGCYKQYGFAWNKMVILKSQVNPSSFISRWVPRGMITMEGWESFLIFFYGITNIFLEHLSNPGGAWSGKDLQHASIAFIYIGSGLCGLITEHMLSDWRFNHMLSTTKIPPHAIHSGSPGYSPNPFPVFTIFWTGILMSQHDQGSPLSTMIHMQWGYLLSYGSFFRLATFILLMLLPNKDLNPARPFTELVTSFTLICGGFIFMQSNDESVHALEYRGLNSMFTLNVNLGIVALLMSWIMILMIWKSRMERKKEI